VFVAVLDEQPALFLAANSRELFRPDQREAPAQLLTAEYHVDLAAGKLLGGGMSSPDW
jgi:hypothetical protein